MELTLKITLEGNSSITGVQDNRKVVIQVVNYSSQRVEIYYEEDWSLEHRMVEIEDKNFIRTTIFKLLYIDKRKKEVCY